MSKYLEIRDKFHEMYRKIPEISGLTNEELITETEKFRKQYPTLKNEKLYKDKYNKALFSTKSCFKARDKIRSVCKQKIYELFLNDREELINALIYQYNNFELVCSWGQDSIILSILESFNLTKENILKHNLVDTIQESLDRYSIKEYGQKYLTFERILNKYEW